MANTFKTIDLTYLNSIADGNDDIIKELIEIFLDQLPEFTEGFYECYNSSNWAQLAALAHKAKSSVMSMGMNEIGSVDLKNLELLAKNRRIRVLSALENPTEKQIIENQTLEKNLLSYPSDRQEWVYKNDNNDTIKQIIDKFVFECGLAQDELKNVLGV